MSTGDHVTPYDRFAWSDTQMERCLARGVLRAELSAYFGAAEYRALARLARRAAAARPCNPQLRVIIVPGIMGSQLGLPRTPPLPNDVLWLDPLDIQIGRLAALALPQARAVVPLGVVLFSYLRLRLYLRARGFAVECHDYDWRLPVAQSGRALAARLHGLAPERVALVAHSMGGLVCRAALALPGTSHVQRLVLLGTPNGGSFAAVQALRGTYAVVRKVARIAGEDSAESLAHEVFSTFPSLYDLLPEGASPGGIPLCEPHAWPVTGPQPRAELMRASLPARAQLAPSDPRFSVIAGVGQETVTSVRRRGEDFVYTLTRQGDGTVPVASATLPGAASFYARVAHSDLTRDALVAAAVVDLIRCGQTRRLPAQWPGSARARVEVSDSQLRRTHTQKVDWASLTPEARRQFLETLNEPPHLKLRAPPRRRQAPHR